MGVSFEDIQKANAEIIPMNIERFDKKSKKTVSKPYAEVHQRIKAFRMVYPDGFIITTMDSNEDGVCHFTASVGYYDPVSGDALTIATGHAYEKETASNINQTSYIENCETSAIGRALGIAGFGIDTAVASADEMANAYAAQDLLQPASEAQKNTIIKAFDKHLLPLSDFLKNNGVKSVDELTAEQATAIIKGLAAKYPDEVYY